MVAILAPFEARYKAAWDAAYASKRREIETTRIDDGAGEEGLHRRQDRKDLNLRPSGYETVAVKGGGEGLLPSAGYKRRAWDERTRAKGYHATPRSSGLDPLPRRQIRRTDAAVQAKRGMISAAINSWVSWSLR